MKASLAGLALCAAFAILTATARPATEAAPASHASSLEASHHEAEQALYRIKPFVISGFLYLVVGSMALVMVARGASRALAAVALSAAFAVNLAGLAFYGWVAGRIPVNNSYEGLLLLAAILGLFGFLSCLSRRWYPVAAMAPLLAAAALLVAEFTPVQRAITPTLPVLRSLWLQAHVTTCFVAYAAFALGFVSSWVVLVTRGAPRRARFDYLAYRSTLFGLVFLSAGILTGAAWAKQAWGRYWGFDPKETWALVTWLIYAGYLHLGLLKGQRHLLRALAAIIGFAAVIFTFFGVNYLLSGLHSYA